MPSLLPRVVPDPPEGALGDSVPFCFFFSYRCFLAVAVLDFYRSSSWATGCEAGASAEDSGAEDSAVGWEAGLGVVWEGDSEEAVPGEAGSRV